MSVKEFPLFRDLPAGVIANLDEISQEKCLKKGEILFFEGEDALYLDILISGSVRLYRSSPKGKEITMHEFSEPTFLAELVHIQKVPYKATCEALSEAKFIRIKFSEFEKTLSSIPALREIFFSSMSRKFGLMSGVFDNEILLNADEKTAKFIVENLDEFNASSQISVAKRLNITPETLSRVLAKFKKLGLLEFRGTKIIKFDEKLRDFLR